MKKKRTIIIKDPCLRKVRYELRLLLFTVVDKKIHEFHDEIEKLQTREGFWDRNHPDYKSLNKKAQYLFSQVNDLRYAFKASIAFCPVCQEVDKDMTYNPVSGEWFCTECYISNQRFEASRGHPELYP